VLKIFSKAPIFRENPGYFTDSGISQNMAQYLLYNIPYTKRDKTPHSLLQKMMIKNENIFPQTRAPFIGLTT
jgi:hypothetical protein